MNDGNGSINRQGEGSLFENEVLIHCKISGDKNSDKFCHFRFRKKLFDGENKHG